MNHNKKNWETTEDNYVFNLQLPADIYEPPVDDKFKGTTPYTVQKVLTYNEDFTKAHIMFAEKINRSMAALDVVTYVFNETIKEAYETRDKAFKEAVDTLDGKKTGKKTTTSHSKERKNKNSEYPFTREEILNYFDFLDEFMADFKKPF